MNSLNLDVADHPHDQQRIGLALSGGGFRATLFHLGVVKFLQEAKFLEKITDITTVSGGSILGAHLVLFWEKYTDPEKFPKIAAELVEFIKWDLRGRILRRWLFQSPTVLLEKYYDEKLFKKKKLINLNGRNRPNIYILATNLTQGTPCYFTPDAWYPDIDIERKRLIPAIPAKHINVALAVAASSAFPALFPPVKINRETFKVQEQQLPRPIYFLTDGGVYDNLGLTILLDEVKCDTVFASDASLKFDWESISKQSSSLRIILNIPFIRNISRLKLKRSIDIALNRIYQMEKQLRNNTSNSNLHFLEIDDVIENTGLNFELPSVLQRQLPMIRTDLDEFIDEEIKLLILHGFLVTQKNFLELNLIQNDKSSILLNWDSILPKESSNCKVEGTIDQERLEGILSKSKNRKSRLLSIRKDILNPLNGFIFLLIVMLGIFSIFFVMPITPIGPKDYRIMKSSDFVKPGDPTLEKKPRFIQEVVDDLDDIRSAKKCENCLNVLILPDQVRRNTKPFNIIIRVYELLELDIKPYIKRYDNETLWYQELSVSTREKRNSISLINIAVPSLRKDDIILIFGLFGSKKEGLSEEIIKKNVEIEYREREGTNE